jgi:hypothetical protein
MRNIIKQVLNEEFDSKSERVKSIVNKYGIDRAIELVVGGVDTIRQSYQDNPLSILNQFNDLTPVEKDDKIFYIDKDGLPLFYYFSNKNIRYIYFNNERIWNFFSNILVLRTSEIREIIKNWLEITYDIKGLTPAESQEIHRARWKRQ